MSTPAVEISIPSAAVAAEFTDGERAVSAGSPGIQAVRYLAKWINLAGGIYTLKLWGADIVTAYVGMEGASVRRIATATDALVEADFFTHPGQQRMDVSLNSVTSPTPYFVMSLWQGGRVVYTSASAGWVYSSTAIPDQDVPATSDPRRILPTWTMSPNWASSITERLSYSTQILPSETDEEQRRSLRRYPRRSIEASFLRKGEVGQRIDTFLSGVGRKSFLVPLWFEQLRLPDGVNVPPEPEPPPTPYWEDTFTAADGTRPNLRDIDIFPPLAGYNRWTYTEQPNSGAITGNALGQVSSEADRWNRYQLQLRPTGSFAPIPESYIGTALAIDVALANVPLTITPNAREFLVIEWDVGYGYQTTLTIWEDGSSVLSSGTGTITSSLLSGTGTVRYVIHFLHGASASPVRYFVNGINQGGEHHSAKSWTKPCAIKIRGMHDYIRITRIAAYSDVNVGKSLSIAGTPASLTSRPTWPTPAPRTIGQLNYEEYPPVDLVSTNRNSTGTDQYQLSTISPISGSTYSAWMRDGSSSCSVQTETRRIGGWLYGFDPSSVLRLDAVTFEMFIRVASGSGRWNAFFQGAAVGPDANSIDFYFETGGEKPTGFASYLNAYYYDTENTYSPDNSSLADQSFTFPRDQWVHVALVMDGLNFRCYVAGSLARSASATSGPSQGLAGMSFQYFWMGTNFGSPAPNVYMDSARASAGALYTGSSFTPPTAQFTYPMTP